ncbi:hypothetical protein B0A49_07891 [Cryomyces minteri]|uniref:Uncharacterized protein n=1 Tax=Cryomyces minteri TaxID=331657 RepID=A0A4U0XG07_9PEZI|nr:hypothetical protein B0A49_07891 [Cryomyces minteri]
MCANNRTIFACHHHRENITLCAAAISPLIRRATTFPYTPVIPEVGSFTGHDVFLTASKSDELCNDCQRKVSGASKGAVETPDLDIWHLDEYMKNSEVKKEEDTSTRIDVGALVNSVAWEPKKVEDLSNHAESNVSKLGTNLLGQPTQLRVDFKELQHVMKKLGCDLVYISAAQLRRAPQFLSIAPLFSEASGQAMTAKQSNADQDSRHDKLSSGSAFLPYTGGLGLYVCSKRLPHTADAVPEETDDGKFDLDRYMFERRKRVSSKL